MKIPQKEKNTLTCIFYDSGSECYYIYDEDTNDYVGYNDIASDMDYEYTVETINGLIDSYLIVRGSLGLWNGTRTIKDGYVTEFENFLKRLSDTYELIIRYDNEEEAIRVDNIHHDGTNVYYLIKPEWLTREELKEQIKYCYEYDNKGLNEDADYYFGKKFNQLTKAELIEFYKEYCLENYN